MITDPDAQPDAPTLEKTGDIEQPQQAAPDPPAPIYKAVYCMLCEVEIKSMAHLQQTCPLGESWDQRPGPHRLDSQFKITFLIGRDRRRQQEESHQ